MRRLLSILLTFLLFPYCTLLAQDDDPDVIEFAFLTDTHKWGPTADVRYADSNIKTFVQYCNEHPSLQFALFGGDFMNAYDTDHQQALYCLEHARRDFEGLRIPFYTTKGNHDCNGKQRTADRKPDNTQIVTDHEYYQLFHPLSSSNPLADSTGIVINTDDPEGNYYYRDFPRQRFRLIVLNDYDIDSLEYFGYHGAQMKWLAEDALDFTEKPDPTQWCFLILGHGFGFNMFGKPISRLLHAYTQGLDFEDSDRGYSYHCQFDKMPRAQLVALLGGHNHEDLFDNPDDYNIIHVNRGFATGGEVGIPDEELCFDHFVLNTREHTLLEKRIGRGRTHMFSYAPSAQIDPFPTFPEAMGMGGFTHGGAKGRELWVTNLNDSGVGSLRWAVEQPGNRMVCFKVSGTIKLQSPLVISNDSISICGHSAPGQGIALQGQSVQIQASEVIMRYLHLRSCELSDHDFGQKNILIDHLSCSFSEGPAISIRRTQNVTVQNCIVSHCRDIGIVAGGYMSTYYHNLIANCPKAMHFPDNEGENRWIHVFRNVFDNWRDHAMYGGGCGGEITIEENYFVPGIAMQNPQMLDVAEDATGRYYANRNVIRGREKEWDRQYINDRPGMPYDPAPDPRLDSLRQRMDLVARPNRGDFSKSCIVIAAFHYRSLFSRPDVYLTWRQVMLEAGCSLNRDRYDQTLIASLRQNTTMGQADGLFSDVRLLGGYPKIKSVSHSPRYSVLANWLDSRTDAVHDRSIVVLFEDNMMGNYEKYPFLAGYHDAIISDSCHVSIVTTGNFLPQGESADGEDCNMLTDEGILQMMNETGYDAIGIGTNELNRDLPQLRELLKPLRHSVISANLRNRDQNHSLAFQPYILKHFGRRTLAYVGLTMPSNAHQSSELYIRSVQQCIDMARQQGADYVVLLTNLPDNTSVGDNTLYISRIMADLHGVDVVLDGSSNNPVSMLKLVDCDGRPVIFSRTGGSNSNIGKLIIAPDGIITTELLPIERLRFKSRRITLLFDKLCTQ